MLHVRIVRPAAVAAALFAFTGCAQWSERTFVRYDVAAAPPAQDVAAAPTEKLRPAAGGGLYEVKWMSAAGETGRAVPASARVVPQGRPIGFAAGPAGVVAVAGEERFPLGRPPADARYVVWATRVPKADRGPARAVDDADDGIAQAVADVVFDLVGEALFAWLGLNDDDDCDDGRNHHRRHHDRKDRDDDKPPADAPTGRGAVPWNAPPASK